MPELLFLQQGSLTFSTNMIMMNLVVTAKQGNIINARNGDTLNFFGTDDKSEVLLQNLELRGIEFNHGSLMAGEFSGSLKLINLKFVDFKAISETEAILIKITKCRTIQAENIFFQGVNLQNYDLIQAGCSVSAVSLNITGGFFRSSSSNSLISISSNILLQNWSIKQNLLDSYKFLEILGPQVQITIESGFVSENTCISGSSPLMIESKQDKTKLTIKDTEITINYAVSGFILIDSQYSMIILINVALKKNIYTSFLISKGNFNVLSLSKLTITENNDISSLFSILYNSSSIVGTLEYFGNSILISEYLSISITSLIIANNKAANQLQGIGIIQTDNYIKQIGETVTPEVFITDFTCQGNTAFHQKLPTLLGNCFNINNAIGKFQITSSIFKANEINFDSKFLSSGATSPCIYSIYSKIELSIVNSVFDGNKGYDGCHCITFVGGKLFISNTNFSNLRSSREDNSRMNQAGALSLGVSVIQIEKVYIDSCSSQKAAGILFQNLGNAKEIFLLSFGLVIKNNKAKQTAGMEFDSSLPNGLYIFNNTLVDSNNVELYGVIALFFNSKVNITFNHSIFTNNTGISAGSLFALFNLRGDLCLVDSNFYKNKLVGDKVFIGGAVALVYGGITYTFIYFIRCRLVRNYCSGKGGAVAVNYGRLIVNDTIFEENSAPVGGSITLGYDSKAVIYNATFIGGVQDIEIKEGGGIYVNDETITELNSCKFLNLKASVAACIKMNGINSRINVTSSLFKNNSAEQGTVIYYFNRFSGWPNYFQDCILQDNIGINQIMSCKNLKIIITNVKAVNNKGKLIVLSQVESQIQLFSITNHACPVKIDQGCFASALFGTKVAFIGVELRNITSGFERDFFFIKDSDVTIAKLIYSNSSTKGEFALAYVTSSILTLISLDIRDISSNLCYAESSSVNITNSLFSNINPGITYKYGAIQCYLCTKLLVSFNQFISVKTNSLGGVFYMSKGDGDKDSFIITYNSFLGGSAISGVVLYAEYQNIIFRFNNASRNNASEMGGVIFLKTDSKLKPTWTVSNNLFTNNEAKSGGCVHSSGNVPFGIYNNTFDGNYAIYGKDYSSFAVRLTLEKKTGNDSTSLLLTLNCSDVNENCRIKNVPSGLSFENILVSIIDTYGQKMVLEQTIGSIDIAYKNDFQNNISFGVGAIPALQAGSSQTTILKGVKSVKSSKGMFNFSELTMIATPKSKVVLAVKTDLINDFMSDFIGNTTISDIPSIKGNQYNFLFVMELRNCIIGEIYIEKENICFPCPEGKYSLNTEDKECLPCPKNAVCLGRDRIIVDHGYWRSNVNSTKIWQCNVVSDPCLGGYESKCKEGYTATICGSCDFVTESTKYFKNGVFYCFPCDDLYKYMIVLGIGVVLLVGVLIFLVWSKQRESVSEGALVKLLINHVQFISFISNIKITLPDLLQNFSSMQAPVTSADTFVFAMDCFKDKFSIPLYSVKILLSIGITLFIILVNCAVFFIIMKKKKKTLEETLVSIVNALVIVAMFLQPQFINFYIQMLSCETYDYSYMVNYLDERCWEGQHLYYSLFITVPMLIFWMFIYPGSFLLYMYKNRGRLNDENVLRITVFFRAGFKQRLYYWEFVIMSRKFCIILLTAFLRNEIESVIYILIPIIAIYCALQIYVRPYNSKSFNFLEIASLNASFVTYYSAIFYLKIISGAQKLLFLIIILGVNLAFTLLWLHQYILKLKGTVGKMGSIITKLGSNVRKSVRKTLSGSQGPSINSLTFNRKLFK